MSQAEGLWRRRCARSQPRHHKGISSAVPEMCQEGVRSGAEITPDRRRLHHQHRISAAGRDGRRARPAGGHRRRHPDGPGHPQGRPVFALPGTTFGPELDVRAEFPTPGIYQQWAQFRLADGEVLTAPFTLRAEATENQGDREGESPWPAGGLRVNVREGTEIGAGSTLIVRRNDRVRTGDFAGFAARGRRRHDWRHWGTGSAGWTGC